MLKIVPPVWFFFFLFVAMIAHGFFPETHAFYMPMVVPGVALIVAGFAITFRASALFKKENTEMLPTSPQNRVLITRDVFAYSRNPMYLGMIVALLGIAVAIGTLPFFLAMLAQFFVLNFAFIPFEEAKMQRQFGEQFLTYKKEVRRWV
jgi:protein-S-isoprenylcysteine O-methyltransferase Ste14